MKIVDTHIHIWDFTKARYPWLDGNTTLLNQPYHIAQLEEARTTAGITAGVLVQAANNMEDTHWMLETAANTDWIKGVVGWLPLTDPATTALALQQYSSHPYFTGMRHLIHDEPDSKWLLQPAVLESLALLADAGLPFDVVGVLPAHIETVLKVAEKIPHLRMVFDHLNQPPIRSKERFGLWGDLMKAAAAHPLFFAKISGLGTTSGKAADTWSSEDIKPYIDFVLHHFGTDSCFCGGDWPVSLLAGTYTHAWQQYTHAITSLAGRDSEKILFDNAVQFYSLNIS